MCGDWPEGEADFKEWLEANAIEVLREIGIGEGRTPLDYGSGSGAFAIPAARIVGREGKVYVLDTDAEALATLRAKANGEGLRNVETTAVDESAPAIPLARGSVDTILLYDMLQLVEDKRSLLAELCRALKPTGFLSVFPMHIGTERMIEIASEGGLFTPRDRRGMILNFTIANGPGE